MIIKTTKDINLKNKVRQYIQENGKCPSGFQCMCKEFLEQESGACHCGLYVKEKD